jgi:hypothetical protein
MNEEQLKQIRSLIGISDTDSIVTRTPLPLQKEIEFEAWRRRLPKNLQPDDDSYDLRGAFIAGLEPELYKEDGQYHFGSRDPNTGLILKSINHPTFYKTIAGENEAGYELFYDKVSRRVFSREKKQNRPQF